MLFGGYLKKVFLRMIINENPKNKKITKALVYGCGQSGRQLVRAMQDSPEILIKGFLDDNNDKHGFFIDGKPIYSPNKLQKIIKKNNINLILLALPSIERKERKKLFLTCQNIK